MKLHLLKKVSSLAAALLAASGFVQAVDYPENIDYGDKGSFIAKRGVEYGRTADLTNIGPVLVNMPEGPGSSAATLENGVQFRSTAWDLSDLTNPTLIEKDLGGIHQPMHAHGTLVRFHNGEEYLWRGNDYFVFDPEQAAAADQINIVGETWKYGWGHNPTGYSTMFTPYNMRVYWEYGLDTSGLFAIRDPYTPVEEGVNLEWLGRSQSGVDGGQPLVAWDHLGLTGVTGFTFMMGELLVVASDQQFTGVAVYEVSGFKEGVTPRLLSTFQPRLTEPNGHEAGIGGYWVEPYGANKVVFAARSRSQLTPARHYPAIFVVDFTNPTAPQLSCEIYFNQDRSEHNTADGDESSDPMYVFFQDQYAYVDHFQVDIEACETAYQDGEISTAEFEQIVYKFEDLANGCDASQYFRPLGQVGVFGGYDFWVTREVNEQGMCFFVTDDEPDTRAPYVSGHRPLAGQQNYPVDGLIHIHIPETLRTETVTDAIRLIAIAEDNSESEVLFRHQLSHTGTISLWPIKRVATHIPDIQPARDELVYLEANTNYRVEISGIQDFMGNTMEDYTFSFRTNDGSFPSNALPEIEGPAPSYALEPFFPIQSSQLACHAGPASNSLNDPIWVVNPDNDSVSIIAQNTDSETFVKDLQLTREIKLGYEGPSSVTAINNMYAVTYQDDDKVVFFDAQGMPQYSVDTGHGTQPVASVTNGDGMLYVSLYGSGEVVKISSVNGTILERLTVGPYPKAMAMHDDRLLVTRFISPESHGEVYDVDTNNTTDSPGDMRLRRIIPINKVLVPDDIDHGSGVPNYLAGIVIDRGGAHAYITATKANTDRGLSEREDISQEIARVPLDDDNTVRAMIATIRLGPSGEEAPPTDIGPYTVAVNSDTNLRPETRSNTIDIDDKADPSGITYLPNPSIRVTALQGNDIVLAKNLAENSGTGFVTGSAPQSMCTTLRTLYVKNFADRSLSAIDISEYLYNGRFNPQIDTISTVTQEKLSEQELLGLQEFYHSSIPEMGDKGYITCASCHNGGGHDGRNWDIAHLGEGVRNTISLNGASGVRFGNLHWTSNFDEVQDFEIQIEQLNLGKGLIPGITFTEGLTPLDLVTAGQSERLDALAAYVNGLGKDSVKRSPHRSYTGELTESALRGQAIFNSDNCGSCHSGTAFRDGQMHDVGTISTVSGSRLGGELSAIRTPSLIELWDSAPFFHDGSAASLSDVLSTGSHTRNYTESETQDLINYLLSIDRDMYIDDNASFPEE